ncbi:tRNA 2-thiouridine synthesizing protein D [Celerinatantimonas diazotrophica]|uniref:tRNA 2-thiouridine synthesizing protein D n=2 Tax=Celerinatantimonas diazotrophica TaxID=412034 RepID=A0A4R1K3V8_9GAMM|nr:tRNA 2-thiouridine synthesizing protein D [Celerinatantimonas diazotrophica]CAG9298269.1 Sulfurtransferase TusD [Celerinatantimonas diazotrophica]
MPLTYTLLVTSAAYGRQGGTTALRFARALVEQGHILKSVFFYLEGTSNANCFLSPASDEHHLYQSWCELCQQTQCQLLVCVGAAARRGYIDHCQAKNSMFNLREPFQVSGLAEMTIAMQQADRVMQL